MRSLLALLLLAAACRPPAPDSLPLETSICVRTQHHLQIIPHATVYVKYNTDTFPGYDKPPGYYDDSFRTDAGGRGCIEPVPEGKHWLVAFGHDSQHVPPEVFGSLPVVISVEHRARIDTTLYVSEEH